MAAAEALLEPDSGPGRFIVAVAHGMIDVMEELYEPQFQDARIETKASFYVFCGSKYNTNRDPRTGQTSLSTKNVEASPGMSAIEVARESGQTEAEEWLRSARVMVKSARKK